MKPSGIDHKWDSAIEGDRVLVIAEAGVNHDGSLERALQMVDAAAKAGADVVKFQTFRAEALVTKTAAKAAYQVKTTGADDGQLEMLKALELDEKAHYDLMERCEKTGIAFLSTPFDPGSVRFLSTLGMKIFKIPSGEITNLPYLRLVGSLGTRVILSTGMASLGEVEEALDALCQAGTILDDVILLHCTTEYPAPLAEVNLLAMETLQSAFPGVAAIGYSDHTEGITVSIAATALGAMVVEKHFTLDRNLPGPDHRASLEPAELAAMVKGIRDTTLALGKSGKNPTPSETRNRTTARKSIVAAKPIAKGRILTAEDLAAKRPDTGISPMRWDEIVGTTALRDYEVDEAITLK